MTNPLDRLGPERLVHALLEPLVRSGQPFRGLLGETVMCWVRAELVVRVGFSEWTVDGQVRKARFCGVEPTNRLRMCIGSC